MTSRISFFKLLKEEWKHHLVSLFVVVVTFLAEILFFYFDVHSALSGHETEYIYGRIGNISSPDSHNMVLPIMLAILLAAEYFSYLHSKKKTDFYMSLPLKRSTQFQMGMIISGIIFAVPCLGTTCAKILIVAVTGYANTVFWENMLWALLFRLIAFAVAWVTMTFAVVMTGHMVIALMGFGAISAYIPLFIKEIYPTFAGMFYDTFTRESGGQEWWYYFSPISLISGFSNSYDWNKKLCVQYLVIAVVYTVLLGIVAWKLYQKRPAEAAGKAMAFEKLNTPIRLLIVVPLALYCGYFLEEMSLMESKVWLIVGTIAGTAFLHGVMESIYEFDLKNMLAKKKQMVATVGLCLSVIAGFYLSSDVFDSYIPTADEVQSVRVSIYDDNVHFYNMGTNANGVEGEQIHIVLSLVENLILQDVDAMLDDAVEQGYSLGSLSVNYKMADGTVKSRMYSIYVDEKNNRELLDRLIGTEDFKEDYFEIYKMEDADISELNLENSIDSEKLWFSKEEQAEFLDVYRKELAKQTFTDMEKNKRISHLTIRYNNEQGWSYEDNCYIYENFEETLSYLAGKGIELDYPMDNCEILSLELMDEFDEKGEPKYVIRDQELLASVKHELVLVDLYGLGYVDAIDDAYHAQAEIRIGNRVEYRNIYIMRDMAETLKLAVE